MASRLDQDENVEIVARQSKFKPGGSALTPDIIFVTNKRVIIRNPTMLGVREKVDAIAFDQITSIQLGKGVFSSTIKLRAYGYQEDIEAIPKDKAEKIVEYIENAMKNLSAARSVAQSSSTPEQQPSSLADELSKLAKLKEQRMISEAEFLEMKQDLMNKKMQNRGT
ncbi:MAG: PH domain-containing protein [Candidatus Nitrosopolaris sp.]